MRTQAGKLSEIGIGDIRELSPFERYNFFSLRELAERDDRKGCCSSLLYIVSFKH